MFAQNVVIDGVIFSSDKKTLVKYPRDKSGEEYIVPEGTEIISEKAFYDNSNLSKIILPLSLKEIENSAFLYTSIRSVVWGNYPEKVGKDIFAGTSIEEFQLADKNTNCVLVDGILFSYDKKTLLRCPSGRTPGDYIAPEGTEIINEYAFEWVNMWKVVLPSSLKTIKEGAFWINEVAPTQSDSQEYENRSLDVLICNALVPPTIIGNPFGMPEKIELYVPESSFNNYCNAMGWREFKVINEQFVSINTILNSISTASFDGCTLYIKSEKPMAAIQLYNDTGVLLIMQKLDGSYDFTIDGLYQQDKLIVKIVFKNTKEQVFKLYKNSRI